MNIFKLAVFVGAIYGGYVMQGVYQAEAAHKEFAGDLDKEIARVDINWDELEGRRIIEKRVHKVAGEHNIPLDARRVKVTYTRNLEFGESRTSTAFYGGNKITYEETPYKGMSRATVSLAYTRNITPYYTKQFSFTGASRRTGNTLTQMP